jgi:hypothetical protein
MTIYQRISSAWALLLIEQGIQQIINDLIEMPYDENLSGDSGLLNIWEEICIQFQVEQSIFWPVYQQTIDSLVDAYVEELPKYAQLAIWLETHEGWECFLDNEYDQANLSINIAMVSNVIKDKLFEIAARYESESLQNYKSTSFYITNQLIAWAPKGLIVPIELVAVFIKPGEITESLWLNALSNRVVKMALASDDPEHATLFACKLMREYLGYFTDDNPHQAGQFLVEDNWTLRESICCSVIDKYPFPDIAFENNQDAYLAIQETDLELWVDLALAQMSSSSLD